MSENWIKMRMDLQTHPKVVRISSALKADNFRTIGGLHAAWSVFDQQSEDGKLPGMTAEAFDFLVRWPGFCNAMALVGWVTITSEGIEMPRFEYHNGKSAKRRAQDAVRKMSAREADKCPDDIGTNCGLDKIRLDEIRLKEDSNINIPPPTEGEEKKDPIEEEFNGIWDSIRKSIPTPTRHSRSAGLTMYRRRRKKLSKEIVLWWWFDVIVKTALSPEAIPAFDVDKQWLKGDYDGILSKYTTTSQAEAEKAKRQEELEKLFKS